MKIQFFLFITEKTTTISTIICYYQRIIVSPTVINDVYILWNVYSI